LITECGEQLLKEEWSKKKGRKANMNSQITGLKVAGVIFGLMGLGQLGRLIIRPEILVAGHQMPLWPSAVAVVILAGMSIWLWKLARKKS